MRSIERLVVDTLLKFTTEEALNSFLTNPRNAAIIVGVLVAVSGAFLGTFLILRQMSMTSDAISHTVLLGIVVAFLVMTQGFNHEPDISSPWLILGAALAGVGTVFLTELIYRSGLVKEDASLGLAFPFLFAIAIILISRYTDNIHLDQDAVLRGQIGLAWGETTDFCYSNCDDVVITPDHPEAIIDARQCINCRPEGEFSPRDEGAVFVDICGNCGTYSASEAWSKRYGEQPLIVGWPKSITTMSIITFFNLLFVILLYKELKLATFDAGLAATLGFRPGVLHYLLMTLASITAVGAFDAVGAVLVVAFFIVPAATAYLLTDRLWIMLGASGFIGALAVYTGYDFATTGSILGIFNINRVLILLDDTIGIRGYTTWDSSISASMVMMAGFFFILAWIVSPRYGLVSGAVRRFSQRRHFAEQMLLAHLANHQHTDDVLEECDLDRLPQHLRWDSARIQRVIRRLQLKKQVLIEDKLVKLTERGIKRVDEFVAFRLS